MSVSIITTYENITINETINDESIYDYINNVVEAFEDKTKLNIVMNITTDKQIISIKIK